MSMSAWHKDRLATSDLVVSPSLYCPVPTIRCHESFPCGASSDGVPIDSADGNPLPFPFWLLHLSQTVCLVFPDSCRGPSVDFRCKGRQTCSLTNTDALFPQKMRSSLPISYWKGYSAHFHWKLSVIGAFDVCLGHGTENRNTTATRHVGESVQKKLGRQEMKKQKISPLRLKRNSINSKFFTRW